MAFSSFFVLAVAVSAVACGGNSTSQSGKTPGSGAEAGETSDASGASSGTGGTVAVGNRGGSSNGSASGGTNASAGANDTSGGTTSTAGRAGSATVGTTQCNDGIDNDGDGLIDGLDPECTGPDDNDEGSFATGIPGDNKDPKWQDCFFDGNSGAGDDGCRYPTGCLTGDLPPGDTQCAVTQACVDYCGALTPNGCDCFGCCTVQSADGSSVDIVETSSCSLQKLDDTNACPRCTKSASCQNTCGECELCPGKTVADLPASCTPPATGTGGAGGTSGTSGTGGASGASDTSGTGGTGTPPPPAYTCDGGQQVCGPGVAACPAGLYCTLGCCTVVVR